LRKYNFHIFQTYKLKVMGVENFRRSLGKAGMGWSQPARVDHMYKKMWAGRRGKFLEESSLEHLCIASNQQSPAGCALKSDIL
jgi:hypothetical protein